MRITRKLWLWLAASCAVLLLSSCGYIVGGGLRQAMDSMSGSAQSQPPGGPPPEVLEEIAPESEEGEPTAGMVGQRVEAGGVALTVQSVERVQTLGDLQADTGQEFVVIDVLIENNSDEALSSGMLPFSLQTSDGSGVFPNMPVNEGGLSPESIEPGGQAQGRIAFEQVVAEEQDLLLQYQPGEFVLSGTEGLQIALTDTALASTESEPAAPGEDEEATPDSQEPAPGTLVAVITNGGNLRSEPRIAPETVVGEVCPQDRVEILQQQGSWNQVRVYTTAQDCVTQRVAVGTEGWVSASLMSQPVAAAPADTPAETPAETPADTPAETVPTEEPGQAPPPADDTGNYIGQTVESNGIAMTVESVELVQEKDGVLASESLDVVVVNLRLENNSADTLVNDPLTFELIDASGVSHFAEDTGTEEDVSLAMLAPGEQITGYVLFVVDDDATSDMTMQYGGTAFADAGMEPLQVTLSEPPGENDDPAAPAPTAPPAGPGESAGVVNNGGNLRSQPSLAPGTVVGQVCPGDTVTVLEQQTSEGIVWYRLRVTALAADCHPDRVPLETEGWLSSVLVTLQ